MNAGPLGILRSRLRVSLFLLVSLLLLTLNGTTVLAQSDLLITAVDWSPDGTRIAGVGPNGLVRVWSASGAPLVDLIGSIGAVNTVAWSPDGRRVAAAGADRVIRIWDAGTGQLLGFMQGHEAVINAISWSPDGIRLASTSIGELYTLRTWDVNNFSQLAALQMGNLYDVAWSPSGFELAAAGADARAIVISATLTGVDRRFVAGTDPLGSITWSPDGVRLAAGDGRGIIYIWDVASGQVVTTLQSNTNWISALAWAPDKLRLASADINNSVWVWNLQTGQILNVYPKAERIAFGEIDWSPDSSRLTYGAQASSPAIVQPAVSTQGPPQPALPTPVPFTPIPFVPTPTPIPFVPTPLPPQPTPTSAPRPVTLSLQIEDAADDVNQEGDRLVQDMGRVWIGTAADAEASYTALRFNNLDIPRGAYVTSAHLEFFHPDFEWITVRLVVAAEASDNSAPFTQEAPPSQRPLTSQQIEHTSDVRWQDGTWYGFNEMASVIQEVVNRPGWQPGNSLSIILRGSSSNQFGRKFIRSFEGDESLAPRLVITYQR